MSLTRQPQRGAALLTAMLIVTLVASLASAMVWRQYRAVQIEAADRARAQSAWILQGALDWARLILREDLAADNRNTALIDHLGEIWAVPLAEARLSTFLAADKNNADDGPEAFLSGSIRDAQAQYNLRQLLTTKDKLPQELRILTRLCETAGVPADTAARLSNQLRAAFASPQDLDPATAPLQPKTLDQLQWLGLSADVVERLRPLVTLLPDPTAVNLNTASKEVIAALYDGMNLASAQRVVERRQSAPLRSQADLKPLLPASVDSDSPSGSFNSSFFIVDGRLRLEERVLEERSLVKRIGNEIKVISRERVNLLQEAARNP